MIRPVNKYRIVLPKSAKIEHENHMNSVGIGTEDDTDNDYYSSYFQSSRSHKCFMSLGKRKTITKPKVYSLLKIKPEQTVQQSFRGPVIGKRRHIRMNSHETR
jgi:hypothetical protein